MTCARKRPPSTIIGLLAIWAGLSPYALALDLPQRLPVVTAASVPLYPRTALLAHIQGSVKIPVTTDGQKIISFDAPDGPPMLVQAAEEAIRTWRFEVHKPTTFLIHFEYQIDEPGSCSVENSTVTLRLPEDVQIKGRRVHTCDPRSDTPGQM